MGLVSIAELNNSRSRSTTALRFAFCVRYRCEITRITPSLLARHASRFSIRFFCTSDRFVEFAKSKSSVTRVLTLFTFCPPGPLLRENLNTSSFSEIKMSPLISIISSRRQIYSLTNRCFKKLWFLPAVFISSARAFSVVIINWQRYFPPVFTASPVRSSLLGTFPAFCIVLFSHNSPFSFNPRFACSRFSIPANRYFLI